jgi:hypothetical protein
MDEVFRLDELSDESLDTVLTMTTEQKVAYFSALLSSFFPRVSPNTEEYADLLTSYISSFYVEKLFRSNIFFSEKFIPIYTNSGLIRNIILDMYFTDDSLLTH